MAVTETVKLTKNQALVLDVLKKSDVPLSAYAVLDELRSEGLKAPLQIYRATDKLQELALVHKLESLNAFVACQHTHCGCHGENITMAFMICESCNRVEEISNDELASQLASVSDASGFTPRMSTVELRGQCGKCQ